jgi:hypothetical protein
MSKNHIRSVKVDGPAPGSYTDRDVQFKKPAPKFGKGERRSFAHPGKTPGPDAYRPMKHTEASHKYSFPLAPKLEDNNLFKAQSYPGPGSYDLRREGR